MNDYSNEPPAEHSKDAAKYVIDKLVEVTELSPSELDMSQSLFELGVDSVILAELMTQVENEFNYSFGQEDMQDFMANPTIEHLVETIARLKDQTQSFDQASQAMDNDTQDGGSEIHPAIQMF